MDVNRHHYLHSSAGGTRLALGVLAADRLAGVITLGVGPFNAPSLVEGGDSDNCLTLTRLWLRDELQRNSESRVLGIVLRSLKRNTRVKFLLAYADPSRGQLVPSIRPATGSTRASQRRRLYTISAMARPATAGPSRTPLVPIRSDTSQLVESA